MRSLRMIGAVAMMFTLFSLGLAQDESSKKDLEKLQGTWKRVGGEANGKKVDESGTLTIQGDQYTLKVGDTVRRGTLKIDASQSPKQIDIVSSEGPNKGKILLGVYELTGDSFRYCIALPGQARAKNFSGAADSGQMLYENKR